MYSSHQLHFAQKELKERIKSIPKQNKAKFSNDLLKLIELAHLENYNNEHFF